MHCTSDWILYILMYCSCVVIQPNVMYCSCAVFIKAMMYCAGRRLVLLYLNALCYTVLHCIVLYYTVLYCTAILVWFTALYCAVLHCIVLYCTVSVLYCSGMSEKLPSWWWIASVVLEDMRTDTFIDTCGLWETHSVKSFLSKCILFSGDKNAVRQHLREKNVKIPKIRLKFQQKKQ